MMAVLYWYVTTMSQYLYPFVTPTLQPGLLHLRYYRLHIIRDWQRGHLIPLSHLQCSCYNPRSQQPSVVAQVFSHKRADHWLFSGCSLAHTTLPVHVYSATRDEKHAVAETVSHSHLNLTTYPLVNVHFRHEDCNTEISRCQSGVHSLFKYGT